MRRASFHTVSAPSRHTVGPLGSGKFLYSRPDGIFLSALPDLIRFLANPSESGRNYVPPLRPTSVEMVAVRELVLRAQVVLPKNLGVGLQLCRSDRFARQTIEDLR